MVLPLSPLPGVPVSALWQGQASGPDGRAVEVVDGRLHWRDNAHPVTSDELYQVRPEVQAILLARLARATPAPGGENPGGLRGTDNASSDAVGPAEWAARVRGAKASVEQKQARLAALLREAANNPLLPPVIADPVGGPTDPRRLRFTPDPTAPRFVFFNLRETFFPYQLGGGWREIQRTGAGERLGDGAPACLTMAASHANEGGYPAQVALRLTNVGSQPLHLELGGFRLRDETYGGWAKRDPLDPVLATGGKKDLAIAPGQTVDLPMLRIHHGGVGSYSVDAQILAGPPADLVIKEIARFEGAAHGALEVGDPWDHLELQGLQPRMPIYIDQGTRVGLPSLFKTHQEFVGQRVLSDSVAVTRGSSLRIQGHNFGETTADDFPLRDRGYAYHVDHVARFTLPDGLPRAFRFKALNGGVAPQLNQQPLTGPNGKRIQLDAEHPIVEVPTTHLLAARPTPWLKITGTGSTAHYELAVSFPNGSSTYLEIEPVY